ncbi:hypothetical protein TNCV_843501 [Trichonephila clavipes]|nr:hypothetical protein TNCV_843501 [Trichonephila clavipes]
MQQLKEFFSVGNDFCEATSEKSKLNVNILATVLTVVVVGLIPIWSSETRPDPRVHKSVQSLRIAGGMQQPPHRKTPDNCRMCRGEKELMLHLGQIGKLLLPPSKFRHLSPGVDLSRCKDHVVFRIHRIACSPPSQGRPQLRSREGLHEKGPTVDE